MKNDGIVPDSSILDEHEYSMYELVCILWSKFSHSPHSYFPAFDDLGTWHSDFKKIAQQVLTKYWNFNGEDETEEVQVTVLYNDLMQTVAYIHGDPVWHYLLLELLV